MTKKDYIKFALMFNHHAKIIKNTITESNNLRLWDRASEFKMEYVRLEEVIVDTAKIFEDDNPRFDHQKFYAACYKDIGGRNEA